MANVTEYFYKGGLNCAESALRALIEDGAIHVSPEAVRMMSGFGGGMLAKLREKHVDGSTVMFTVDYYAGDDVGFTAPEYAKTYTLTFFYGRYRYESAVEAA